MISELKGITIRQSIIFLFVFLGSVSPGALIIFYFDRDLFINLDSMKLIVLSLAISLPVVLLNMFVAPIHTEASDKKENLERQNKSETEEVEEQKNSKEEKSESLLPELMVSFWITAVILYISVGLAFWNGASVKEFIGYAFIGQLLSYLTAFGTHLSNKRKQRKLTSAEDLGLSKVEGQS